MHAKHIIMKCQHPQKRENPPVSGEVIKKTKVKVKTGLLKGTKLKVISNILTTLNMR